MSTLEEQKKVWQEKYGKVILDKIESAKKKHGEVSWVLTEDDRDIFLHKPSRHVVDMAMAKSRTNPLGLIQVLLDNCWVGGDVLVKSDSKYLVGLAGEVDSIIGTVKAEVKKL